MRYRSLQKDRLYIFSAHDEMQKSADTAYAFQQDPYFFWLTSLTEPGWLLVVNTATSRTTLLAPERDTAKTLFDGSLSDDVIYEITGVDAILEKKDQADFLEALAREYPTVYMVGEDPHQKYYHHTQNPATKNANKRMAEYFKKVEDCRNELDALRAIKSDEEIETMRQAIATSLRGFEKLKTAIVAGASYEYELEATLNYEFRVTGAHGHAYDPIVAGGKNACTLHYGKNNAALPKSGLVLVDAGAAMNGYCADITRTYAISAPTARQIAVHNEVEKAHHQIIALIKPDVSLKDYSSQVDEIMKTALENLGLLQDRDDTIAYRTYFPHAISHGLGIDVHEALGGFGVFKPGMVLTVEPGIYIPEEGVGVRIEDDILVTSDGNENLSAALSTSL